MDKWKAKEGEIEANKEKKEREDRNKKEINEGWMNKRTN